MKAKLTQSFPVKFRPHIVKSLALSLGLTIAGISLIGSHSAQAQATYYWDENDAASGFGTAGTTGTAWSPTTSLFTTDATGATAPTGAVVTGTTDAINFGASSALPLGSGTIAVTGTVGAGSITYSGSTGAITLSSGGTIVLNGTVAMNTPSTQTINSNIDLNGANRTFVWNSSGSNGSMIVGGSVSNSSGTAGIIVTGGGSLTLAGINTFNGNVQIGGDPASTPGSILIVSSVGNQGSTISNLGAGTSVNLGSNGRIGTLRYSGTGETSNRLFTNSSGNAASSAIIDQSGTGLLTLTGSYTNSGAAKSLTLTGTGVGEYAGVITDGTAATVLSLNKSGSGTWTLSGSNNYRGTTTVNGGGTLLLGNNAALGTGGLTLNSTGGSGTALINGAFTIANNITVSTSATAIGGNTANASSFTGNISINTSGFNVTQVSGGTLTLSGTLSPTSNNRAVNFSNVGNVLVTGPITGAQMAVTQNGAGTTTLSGINTYGLATTVNAGRLIVSGSITVSATTTITNNATLGGAGGVQAVTTTAGTISPGNLDGGGNSIVGTLSTKNFSATTSTAHLALQLGSTSAGTTTEGYNIVSSDRVNTVGTVDITGADLNLLSIGTPAVNDVFFLLINDSSEAVTGQFGSYFNGTSTVAGTLIEGSTITFGSQAFKLTYAANFEGNSITGGNDIALQAVPEPGTWTMMLGGLGTLVFLQRRRRLGNWVRS